jgi:hypothetical protein
LDLVLAPGNNGGEQAGALRRFHETWAVQRALRFPDPRPWELGVGSAVVEEETRARLRALSYIDE